MHSGVPCAHSAFEKLPSLSSQVYPMSRGYSMLRNSASGPEIGLPGRILAGLLPGKNRNRPSGRAFGQLEGRILCFPGSSPAPIRARKADLRPGSIIA